MARPRRNPVRTRRRSARPYEDLLGFGADDIVFVHDGAADFGETWHRGVRDPGGHGEVSPIRRNSPTRKVFEGSDDTLPKHPSTTKKAASLVDRGGLFFSRSEPGTTPPKP